MNKNYNHLFLGLCLIIMLAMMAQSSYGQNYADAGWVDGTTEYPLPEIDGQVDPIWQVQDIYELLPEDGLYTLREDTEIPYEDDYSIQFRVMWNAENQLLFVLFEIIDDTLVTDSSGEWTPDDGVNSNWFMDDACTIMLKNFQDQDLEFAWVPFTPYEHKAFNQYPDAVFFQEEIESAWAETENGYVLETMIYLDGATGLSHAANDEIAFDAQGKDDDNGAHFDYKVYFASNGPSPDGFLLLKSKENSKSVAPSIVNDTFAALELFRLEQNYPNPFNPTTEIQFTLPKVEWITLNVYNEYGQAVKNLVTGFASEGQHNIKFNATDLSSGTYFYKLETSSFSKTRRMVLLK